MSKRAPSVYVQTVYTQIVSFVGLMIAGMSPIIGVAIGDCTGLSVFAICSGAYIYSMVAMGRVTP